MKSMLKIENISSKNVLVFVVTGFVLALVLSIGISFKLANTVSLEVKQREMELLFGAIESGPLAIARLQSADFAQQALFRLLSHPKLIERGLISVEIRGGSEFMYNFAHWKDPNVNDNKCTQVISKTFLYPDSINPFKIVVKRDECFVLSEAKTIFLNSGIASAIIVLIVILILSLAVWPAATSLREAEVFLTNNAEGTLNNISFIPLRNLVKAAIINIKLQKDAALAKVAAQVSHDIRSPLSALNMALYNLKEIPDQNREVIASATARINDIANELLSLGKADCEADESSTIFTANDLMEIIDSILLEKKVQYSETHEVQFKKIINIPNGLVIGIGRIEIARVFSNLLNNSVEAIDSKGTITLKCNFDGKFVNFEIVDDGKGIPTEIFAKIGERGVSFGKNIFRGEGGSGLGLSFVKEMITEKKGKFKISSVYGKGTSVQFSIPSTRG